MIPGKELRDKGQDDCLAAAEAVHRQYKHHAEKALARLARTGVPFHADHVRALLPATVQPHSDNVLPSLFGTWAQRHRIRRVGEVTSTRKTRHASRNSLWIGVVA